MRGVGGEGWKRKNRIVVWLFNEGKTVSLLFLNDMQMQCTLLPSIYFLLHFVLFCHFAIH